MSENVLTPPPLKVDNKRERKPAQEATLATPEQTAPRPKARRGDIVDWFLAKDERFPAIVRHVNEDGSLRLTIFGNQPLPDVSRLAVHHVNETVQTDENLQRRHYGFWDYRPQ